MKTIKCKFAMNLWNRIRLASRLWWDIVINGEMECMDDEEYSEMIKNDSRPNQTQ
jgi:hypothetical protein